MSPKSPCVVEAEPTEAHAAPQFWENHCRGLGSDLQFIGLDGDKWTDHHKLARWVKDFHELLVNEDKQKRLLLTTIVVLTWPERGNQLNFSHLERFRDVLLARANLRMKRARYYQRDGGNFLESLCKDLEDSGLLAPPDSGPPPKPRKEPKPTSEEEKREYQQCLEFYGDPPFQWDPDDLAALFKKKPSKKTKAAIKPPKTKQDKRPKQNR